VTSRGDRREKIFLDDVDRQDFIKNVYLNPVRAGMLPATERLLSYPWSSFGAYPAAQEQRHQARGGVAAEAGNDALDQSDCRADAPGQFQGGKP